MNFDDQAYAGLNVQHGLAILIYMIIKITHEFLLSF